MKTETLMDRLSRWFCRQTRNVLVMLFEEDFKQHLHHESDTFVRVTLLDVQRLTPLHTIISKSVY